MQRPSASRAENYQLLWDTIASLKQCEQAMQHAFILVRKFFILFSWGFKIFLLFFFLLAIDKWHVVYAFNNIVSIVFAWYKYMSVLFCMKYEFLI